jgi:hypothetical protein
MTPEAMDKVRQIFAETLDERYAGQLEFDPIIVKPDVGYYGDDYVRVLLVVNGNTDLLDAEWDVGLITRVRDKLNQLGIYEFPSPYFIESKEFQYYLKRGKVETL